MRPQHYNTVRLPSAIGYTALVTRWAVEPLDLLREFATLWLSA